MKSNKGIIKPQNQDELKNLKLEMETLIEKRKSLCQERDKG